MKTEDLIVSLAADARAVKTLPPMADRGGRWVQLAFWPSLVLVLVFGVRRDLLDVLATPAFVLIGVLSLLVALGAMTSALSLSVPGEASPVTGVLSLGLLLLWIAVLVASALTSGASLAAIYHEPWHWACITRVSLLSVVPSLALWIAVRRGFVLDHGRSTFLSFIGGGAIAALALQFVCPVDRGAHLLVSHLVPVLVLSMGAALVQFIAARRT